jgi:hypothetical protein
MQYFPYNSPEFKILATRPNEMNILRTSKGRG